MTGQPSQRSKLLPWWAIWLVALAETGLVFLFLSLPEEGASDPMTGMPAEMLVLIPLGLSILIRWGGIGFVRNRGGVAFVLFITGIVLAVIAAHLSLFIGVYFGRELFTISVLGIVQYVPLFARQYYES